MSWAFWSCCSVAMCQPEQKDSGGDPPRAPVKAARAATGAGKGTGGGAAGGGGGEHGAAKVLPAVTHPPQDAGKGAGSGAATPLNLPPNKDLSDKLDSCDNLSVASSAKHSTRSGISNVSSVGTELINSQIPPHKREVLRIQSMMKTFVKGMLRGRELSVLSVDGQLRSCTCSFDRKLRNYSIVISKETRTIPLSRFREVFQGTEPQDIATPLDELCATFVLDTGECLTFRFNEVKEREDFAMCLQIIVDGHQ